MGCLKGLITFFNKLNMQFNITRKVWKILGTNFNLASKINFKKYLPEFDDVFDYQYFKSFLPAF